MCAPTPRCPAIVHFVVKLREEQPTPPDPTFFLDFIYRSHISLKSLIIQDISFRTHPSTLSLYLLPTMIRSLSLTYKNITIVNTLSGLSEKMPNDDSFRFVPELEHLELVGYNATIADHLANAISVRWNARNRTLKSVKLTQCYSNGAVIPQLKIGDDPAQLRSDWRSIQEFVNEGLFVRNCPLSSRYLRCGTYIPHRALSCNTSTPRGFEKRRGTARKISAPYCIRIFRACANALCHETCKITNSRVILSLVQY